MRIVVWQPAYLGDVVFASPLTAALAARWPDAELCFVARPPADQIARCLPGVRQVVSYDKRGRDRGLTGARRVAAELRALQPDFWLSLHGSLRSGLFARASGAKRTLGPAGEAGSWLFGERVPFEGSTFPGRAVALAAALGLQAEPRLRLTLTAEQASRGRRAVGAGRTVAVIPGSEWETKRWPVERAADLARRLLAQGFGVLLLGSPAERPLCSELAAQAPGCRDLCGNSVTEALGILAACEAVVGGDSGLVHAARALGVPAVVLFGPTAVAQHVPRASDAFVSLGLDCAPCSDHGGRRCPLGHHRCLRDLDAERVERELVRLRGAA